jgi:CRP-like cAMP-binding protein
VIDEGEAEIFIDGRFIVERAAGDCFGEIALLWDKPRIATVRAKTPLRVIALERSEFMAGIAAHARSTSAAERLAAERSVVPEPAPS